MPPVVSRETRARLDRFVAELQRWNRSINLIAAATETEIWARHVADSLQLLALRPTDARTWADLGTGGGFPGLAVAIAAAEQAPEMDFTLVESDARKAAFLARAADATGIRPQIRIARAEVLPPLGADVVSARALAPLPRLLGLAQRHLAPHGVALLPKGRRWREEVEEALASWSFAVQNVRSQTDPTGAVLIIQGVTRA